MTQKPSINQDARYHFAGIPNNARGRAFVAGVRRFVNPGVVERVRVRGQSAKRGEKRGAWGDLRMAQARTLRIYLDQPNHQGDVRAQLLEAERESKVREFERDRAYKVVAEQCDATRIATEAALALQRQLNDIPAWVLWCIGAVRAWRRKP